MLRVPISGTTASVVRQAMEQLGSRGSKAYKATMTSTTLGQSLWAQGAEACAAGALDEHSQSLFGRASTVFDKEMMPKPDGLHWTNVQLDDLRRGQVCDILQDAMRDAFESFQQWSQSGVEGSIHDIVGFFTKLKAYLFMLDNCEWGVLIKAAGMLHLVFAYDSDGWPLGNLHNPSRVVDAEAFVEKFGAVSFQRGPLLNLLCRINEAKERADKVAEAHVGLRQVFEDIYGTCVGHILTCSKVRASIWAEMHTICHILRSPLTAPWTTQNLITDFQDKGDKSCVKLACRLVETRQTNREVGVTQFSLHSGDQIGDKPLFDDKGLTKFLDFVSDGIPMGAVMIQTYLTKPFVDVEEAWVAAARAGFRIAEAEELRLEDSKSPKSIIDSILGSDLSLELAKTVSDPLQGGEIDVTTSLAQLPVQKASEVLAAMNLVVASSPDRTPRYAWLAKVGGPPQTTGPDEVPAQWVSVLTETTRMVSLASYLSMKYEGDQNPCTSMSVEENITSYKVHPVLLMATQGLMSMVRHIESECEGMGVLFERFRKKLQAFYSAWSVCFFSMVAKSLGAKLAQVSQTTHSMSPNWKYFITDAKYTHTLATKFLLTDTAKVSLPAQTNAHHEFMTSVSEAFAAWGIEPPSANAAIKKDFSQSAEALSFAQDTVMVVAAVSILEETKAAQQASAAAALLQCENAKNMPESLRRELTALKAKK